ncbi:MAG: HAMP domain-containing histidine kinase [Clostridia bacterium]|nr:HAMP domain-containing histidine kinase [Clostridia bacterium]
MFKSVFIKYVTAFMLINISCMIILTTIISSIISTYNANVKENTLKNAAQYISEYLSDGVNNKDFNDIHEYTTVYPETIHTYLDIMSVNVDKLTILVTDETGKVVIIGGSEATQNFDHVTDDGLTLTIPKEFINKLKTDKYVSEHSKLNGVFEKEHIIYSLPIYADNRMIGAVIACSDNAGMNVLLDGTVKTIFMSTLWIMLAMLVAVYFISERLVSPIKAMSRAAKMFAKGKFDVRIPVYGDDEVSELATAFNNMASSLSTNEEMRRVFLANVSHDLRTPMTTISGFIDGIIDGAIPPEKHEYYLGIIASEVRRLSRLVSSLLDISKIQAGERKFTKISFDICELCRQVLISSEQRIETNTLTLISAVTMTICSL